jgi:hypothetical protein
MPPFRSSRAARTLSRPQALRSGLAGLLVLTTVGLAACGGGSSPSASSTSSTTTPATTTGTAAAGGPGGAAFARYTSCLEQHGVTLPTRGSGGGGPATGAAGANGAGGPGGFFGGANSAKFRTAQTACANLLPAGLRRGGFGGGAGGGANSAAFAAYRNCLSLHGVTLAAAGFRRNGGQGAPKPTAKMTKALKACASLRPSFTGRPPSSTTTPTTATS